jgi:hypothetical protein
VLDVEGHLEAGELAGHSAYMNHGQSMCYCNDQQAGRDDV